MYKKKAKFLKYVVILLITTFCMWTSAVNSQVVDDFLIIRHHNDSERSLALAFTVALRKNSPVAYELVDSKMHSQIDDWMKTHEPLNCFWNTHEPPITDTESGYQVGTQCLDVQGRLSRFWVEDIVIQDMKIVGWGEILSR